MIDFTFVQPKHTADMEQQSIPDHIHTQYVDDSYVQSAVNTAAAGKVNTSQGVDNAGKVLVVGADGNVTTMETFSEVSSVTRWNVIRPNQTETPNLTLPTPESGKPQEILYVFTAMTTGATFTAPSGYSLFDEDKTLATATNSIAYTDLTVGNLYECDFLVVGPNKISLLKVEHAGV